MAGNVYHAGVGPRFPAETRPGRRAVPATCRWVLLAGHLLRIFASVFTRDVGLWFPPVASLSGFRVRVMLASEKALGRVPSFSIFGKVGEGFGVRS